MFLNTVQFKESIKSSNSHSDLEYKWTKYLVVKHSPDAKRVDETVLWRVGVHADKLVPVEGL